jgi:hypothetical protein
MLLWILTFTACGDDFAATQADGSLEAYEAYLEANPSGRHTLAATSVLETKYLERAREQKRLEAYDAYLERFPDDTLRDRVLEEREGFLFDWAMERRTEAGWDRFLTEYPKADRKRKDTAKRLRKVDAYAPKLSWTPLVVEPVNLAENPDGPKDGWGFTTSVTNDGPRTITDLRFTLELMSPKNTVITASEWPLVAPVWPLPIEEEHKVPMRPGETRVWRWSSEDPAPGTWKQETRFRPTRIAFLD